MISATALSLAALHVARPNLAIDGKLIALLLVAIAPWLGTIFESLEFPGGWKIKYRDLKDTEIRAREAGLLPASSRDQPNHLVALVERDPNLALAGLRIEIEKRLRKIAEQKGIDTNRLGLGQLLRKLTEAHALSAEASSALADMTNTLNLAAHGASVEPQAAAWTMHAGPEILSALDSMAGEQ